MGEALTSPNDVAVRVYDGSLWFTDPDYGCQSHMGHGNAALQNGNYLYRVDEEGGEPEAMVIDMKRPNGIAFSHDEKLLYVSDSGAAYGSEYDPNGPRHVMVYEILDNLKNKKTKLSQGNVFVTVGAEHRYPDGLTTDQMGNLYVCTAEGVHIYTSDTTLIAKVLTPKPASNAAFGGWRYHKRSLETS